MKLLRASLGRNRGNWNGEKSTFNLGKLRGLTIAGSSFSSNKITDLGKSHDRLWLPYTRAREGRGELRNLVRASLTFARKTRNQLAVWLARARSNPGSGQTRFALRLREAECAASTMNQAPHFILSRPSRRIGCPTVSCLFRCISFSVLMKNNNKRRLSRRTFRKKNVENSILIVKFDYEQCNKWIACKIKSSWNVWSTFFRHTSAW